jgi:hypothetical protein
MNISETSRIEALERRLTAIEGPAAPDISDLIAPPVDKGRIKKLKQLFAERKALLARIDEAIDVLCELYTAEKVSRSDIVTVGLQGADKYAREQIRSDARIVSAMLSRLARGGIGTRVIGHDVPHVAALADDHTIAICQIEGK